MKIRAIANGNIVEVDDLQAKALIAAGVFERVVEPEKPEEASSSISEKTRRYKRRDLQAEESGDDS